MSGIVQALIGSLAGVVKDAFWSSVSLLLPGNGTNGAQNNTFLDASTNNFTITRNGNTTQGTFTPFTAAAPYSAATKGGSGYFDGNGDYLEAPANTNLYLNGTDYTIECWVYATRAATTGPTNNPGLLQAPLVQGDGAYLGGSNDHNWYLMFDSTNVNFGKQPTPYSAAYVLPTNQWVHVAVVGNSSGSITVYINGTSLGTQTSRTALGSATWATRAGLMYAGNGFYPNWFQGYIAGARVVKGTQVYTSNFTPSTSPLTAITNTQLLLNFTNAGIIDNAMLNNLETAGNAQISTTQSKFGGSSMYFDGTGDYLVSNSDANNYAFGSGDFTIEMWVRYASTSGIQVLYDGRPSGVQGAYPTIYSDAGSIRYFTNTTIVITGSTLSINVWYHIAVARSGTSTKMFIDGIQAGATYTDSTNYLGAVGRPSIGDGFSLGTYPFNGYIDDLRITKGVARYTATFTPPAAAFPTS